MASNVDPTISKSQNLPVKKKRIPGACDNCKKKKIRCDSAEMLGNRCSNCIQSSLECSHKEVSKSLGSAKGYVESLENRLEKMEKLLNKLKPGLDLNQELDETEGSESPPNFSEIPRNDESQQLGDLTERLTKLYVGTPRGRFYGKSSGWQLVQTALDIRMNYIGKESEGERQFREMKRHEFWDIPDWFPDKAAARLLQSFSFPPDDLMSVLVNAFFTEVNPYLPLLHRPTFQKFLYDGFHHIERSFGTTVLLVCALGAKHVEDPRVYHHYTDSPHAVGFKWFEQVHLEDRFLSTATLDELQNYALYIMFLQSTVAPQDNWIQVAVALRRAQEVGAHRKRQQDPLAEQELWKRAFWVLMCLDQLFSAFSGRQCMVQEEDYDVDLPIECDDEYWDHPDPSLNFRQPEAKPSTISYFNWYLRLMNISSHAMRIIYSVRKPESNIAKAMRCNDQRIIMELDSALNNWMDTIPEHLRWDPKREDKLFQTQSAALHAMYYYLQICIHRPFIPSFRNPSPTTFPSLAICTNAARSCCHVLDTPGVRNELQLQGVQMAIFTSTVVLLLNIWSGKRSGKAPRPHREIEDVEKCMNMLKTQETRWCSAGRYLDVLVGLSSAGSLSLTPISDAKPPSRSKRRRETDDGKANADSPSSSSDNYTTANPTPAAAQTPPIDLISSSIPPAIQSTLPMYGDELGKLPVYGQIDFYDDSFRRTSHQPQVKYVDFSSAVLDPSTSANEASVCYASSEANTGLPVAMTSDFGQMPDGLTVSSDFSRLQHSQQQASLGHWGTPRTFQCGVNMTTSESAMSKSVGVGGMDPELLTMWSTAPNGFELDQWGTYMTNVNRLTR